MICFSLYEAKSTPILTYFNRQVVLIHSFQNKPIYMHTYFLHCKVLSIIVHNHILVLGYYFGYLNYSANSSTTELKPPFKSLVFTYSFRYTFWIHQHLLNNWTLRKSYSYLNSPKWLLKKWVLVSFITEYIVRAMCPWI